MMKVADAKRLNMDELENVNGGGFFDIISDFVVDLVKNPPFEIPDEGCIVMMIADKLIDIFSNNLYDTLVDEKKKQQPQQPYSTGFGE